MTPEQLHVIMWNAGGRVEAFAQLLSDAMSEFGVTSSRRQAAFIAQVAHESGELRFTKELASGDAYEGRLDLGNNQAGDGARFKGRGLLQITGRAGYTECGIALKLPLNIAPTLLETPGPASRSAAWFWSRHGLNELADADKFGEITHRINGGYNHLDERIAYWLTARNVVDL